MSKCDERFARQYRYEPPPEFPLASPCSDIVHHLSGPNICAHTQTSLRGSWPVVGAQVPTVTFTSHMGFDTHILAHVYGLLGPCFKTGHSTPCGPTHRREPTARVELRRRDRARTVPNSFRNTQTERALVRKWQSICG